MKLLEAPGNPQDESQLTPVQSNAKTGQATNAGTSPFDLSLGLTASGMRWCQANANSPIENFEITFGFGSTATTYRIGLQNAIDNSKC